MLPVSNAIKWNDNNRLLDWLDVLATLHTMINGVGNADHWTFRNADWKTAGKDGLDSVV